MSEQACEAVSIFFGDPTGTLSEQVFERENYLGALFFSVNVIEVDH